MADQAVEGQKAVFHHAISRQRYLAAPAQRACKGAFGGNAGGGFFVVQRTQDVGKVGASGGDFDAQCALPCRGQAVGRREDFADAAVQAQALQAGGGKDDGIVIAVVELGQAGLDVAAQGFDGQVRELCPQLCFAAQAGCADDCACGHFFQTRILIGYERVKRAGAFADCRQCEPFRQFHRHVFDGVDGQIGTAVLQCLFEFFDKQAFAADFRQCAVEDLVAARRHAQNFHFAVGIQCFQTAFDVFGLPHRQHAFPAGDNQFFRCVHRFSLNGMCGPSENKRTFQTAERGCFRRFRRTARFSACTACRGWAD